MADVLIVDDEPDVRRLLADVVAGEGYSSVSAVDGQAALDCIARGATPTLVIADLMMPRLSGAELAATLRARYREDAPPVVVMSANHRWLNDVVDVAEKLPKPFPVDAVVRLLDRYCSSSSS